MGRCEFPEGMAIKPDGVHELESACVYELVEAWRNVTVEILRCPRCGHVTILWRRQEDTEEILEGETI